MGNVGPGSARIAVTKQGTQFFSTSMNAEFVVKKGQSIKRGQLIGYVGSSGGSTAPHCHYEIHKDGRKVDPIQYIIQDVTDEEYEILLDLASRENQSLG